MRLDAIRLWNCRMTGLIAPVKLALISSGNNGSFSV